MQILQNEKLRPWVKIIGITITALTTGLSFFTVAPALAMLGASIVCPLLKGDNPCSMDNYGPLLFYIGAIIVCVATSTLLLRYLVKLKLLLSVMVSITSLALTQLVLGSLSSVWQADFAKALPVLFVGAVIIVFAFLLHSLIFVKLRAKPKVSLLLAAILVLSYAIVLPAVLRKPLEGQHQLLENQKNLKVAEVLPFQVYAPANVPNEYSFIYANAIPAFSDSTAVYQLHYSTHSAKDTLGAKTLYFDEREFAGYNPPAACDANNAAPYVDAHLGECVKIGRTNNCEVYYQFPSISHDESSNSFCKIGDTHITLTVYRNEISKDAIVKLFDSMKPADVKELQEKASQSERR